MHFKTGTYFNNELNCFSTWPTTQNLVKKSVSRWQDCRSIDARTDEDWSCCSLPSVTSLTHGDSSSLSVDRSVEEDLCVLPEEGKESQW